MPLSAGTRLGPYEITGPLGAGGMGEVYRARDSRLGREVAIKVLPETVAGNAEAWSRFEREAKAVASLSHPNILALHDFGVENGTAYSVTELLEGETLRARLDVSSLPVRKVIDYGSQIARGLAAAHDKGVVHRDLKPENIFITHDGRAKILDFGLAKIAPPSSADLTSSPTVDAGTRPGTVMGTMAYMSPEQVRGREVDPRSDIFAFGSVLHEMLTGRAAFRRDTPADTMSAILKEDPPTLAGTSMEIPPALQRIVEHCLEKNPSERFQSARDLAFQLDAVGAASTSAAVKTAGIDTREPRRGLRVAAVFLAGLALGAGIGAMLAARLWAPQALEPPRIRYLSYSGRDGEPSASADGRLIAYPSGHEGRSQIWLKQHPGGDEVALTTGPDDRLPRISPDGSQVLFTRIEGVSSSLFKIPIVGGEPRKIADDAYDGDWSPDGGSVVFVRDGMDGGTLVTTLWVVDAAGQGSREIAAVELALLGGPRWSPDGKTVAVVKLQAENAPNVLMLVPVSGGESRILTPAPPPGRLSSPVWTGDGSSILYAQSGSFAASSADEGAGRVMLHHIDTGETEVRMWLPNSANVIDTLGDGELVLGVSVQRQNLVEAALAGERRSSAERGITRGNSADRQPVFSRDGSWVLFSSNRGGDLDLWKLEVATGAIRRITEDRADDWDPAFTPDGRSIVWSSNRAGHFEIWTCAADGTGARQLSQDGFDAENPTVTPDGEWIVYNSTNPKGSGIWKIHPDGTGAVRIVAGSFSTPDVSPDGKHVAFRSAREPRSLFIARVEDGEHVIEPIDVPGSNFNARPRWMPDGTRFLYTASDATGARGVYVQDFVPGRDTTAGRRPLLEFVLEEPPETYGIAPDGTRIIFSKADTLNSLMLAEGLSGVTRPGAGAR